MRPDTKRWLQSLKALESEIDSLRDEQSRILTSGLVTSLDPNWAKGTPSGNTSEQKNVKYAMYTEQIEQRVARLIELKTDIHNAIDAVNSPVLRTLLTERYINFKSFLYIARKLDYTYSHVVKTLHPQALKEVVIPDKYIDDFQK